jgi:hypothetical protein
VAERVGRKDFAGFVKKTFMRSRSAKRRKKNLGIIEVDMNKLDLKYRDPALELYDSYYENRQFEQLPDWDDCNDPDNDNYVPIRKRRPRFMVPFAKMLSGRLVSMMVGGKAFPTFAIKDFPDEQEFLAAVIRESKIKSHILEPLRRALNTGSSFIRFKLVEGVIKIEWFHSKYCYPKFAPNGELQEIEIKYVYVDKNERDEDGDFKMKWFRMILGANSETLFDNPEYDLDQPEVEPNWQVVDTVEHNLGFVQGVWFRTCEHRGTPDGYALVADVLDFIDELCYSYSQSSQAVSYNQDPQLAIKGMDEEEASVLVRSAMKSWLLGKNGEAEFMETNLTGVQVAGELRDKVKQTVQDVAHIVLLDPEKIVGSAQSAKAMEILHGPMVALADELREVIAPQIHELIIKMSMVCLIAKSQGMDVPFEIPDGWQPQTLAAILRWGKYFEDTMEDKQKTAAWLNTLVTGNIIARKTATRYVAENCPELNIQDPDAEQAEIAAQPQLNPFGTF